MSRNTTEFMGTPEELCHWVPDEMVVIVRLPRRPAENTQESLAEQVRSQLNDFLAKYNLMLEPYGTYGRWRELPGMPSIRHRSFIFGLHRQQPLIAIFFHTRHIDPELKDPMPMALSYLQGHLEQLAEGGLHLVSAMPNWLVTAASSVLYGNGGPAFPPHPAPLLDLPTPTNEPIGWRLSFAEQGFSLDPNGAEEVLVAVLDTAQSTDRIWTAASRPAMGRNWLLQRLATDLRSDNGSFEIEYDRYLSTTIVRTGRDLRGEPLYYVMPDHGLFVAGIIRDLAPRTRIRLIRILNDYGGGDLYALFAALTDLEQELVTGSIRRLVINLSLAVLPEIHRLPYIWFGDRRWPSPQLAGAIRILTQIEEGVRLLFESLHAHGALIVASAGNDSLFIDKQRTRPRSPRAPARYESTLSVTAVNSRFTPAQFANAASMPPLNAGVATFGGDGFGVSDAQGWPDAVRGVYVSSTFPHGEQNLSGWADWSGSSFAAPMMSALGAHLMAQGLSASQAMSRIAAGPERRLAPLFGSPLDAPSLLTNIVRVQQQFRP